MFLESGGSFVMKYCIPLGASVAVLLAGSILAADEALKSGPQVGQNIPGPFNPLNVTGPSAGEKACQV
jgi:hypothetical protein